jgi:hypothetical protein
VPLSVRCSRGFLFLLRTILILPVVPHNIVSYLLVKAGDMTYKGKRRKNAVDPPRIELGTLA